MLRHIGGAVALAVALVVAATAPLFGMRWEIVLLPLLVFQIAALSLGVGLWMSALTAKYRDFFHLSAGAIARVEIVLKERSEVDFLKGIFLFGGDRGLFRGSLSSGAVAVFLLAAYFVDERDGFFELFENRVLDHLGVDHVFELKLIEREDRDHLHQTRGKDLALR